MFGFRNFDYIPYHLQSRLFNQVLPWLATTASMVMLNRITTLAGTGEMHKDFIVKWKDNYNKDLKAKF